MDITSKTDAQQIAILFLATFAALNVLMYALTIIKGFLIYIMAGSQKDANHIKWERASGVRLMKTGCTITTISFIMLLLFLFIMLG